MLVADLVLDRLWYSFRSWSGLVILKENLINGQYALIMREIEDQRLSEIKELR